MIQRWTPFTLLISCACAAWGQAAEKTPPFVAADVHVSPPTLVPRLRGGALRGDLFEIRDATMVDLIRLAYNPDAGQPVWRPGRPDPYRADKISGGPAWLDTDRFDVIARSPAGTPPETVRLMLRALLAERFHLEAHADQRPVPAYALLAGPHPNLQKADGSGVSGCRFEAPRAGQESSGDMSFTCHNVSMADLAEHLHESAGDYFNGTVVDRTGLVGIWDFKLRWSIRVEPNSSHTSVYDAVSKQLGLRLEIQKVPMAVVVVDRVDRKPAANPPGAVQALSSGAAEFEVADVKPSDPASNLRAFHLQPGGRVNIQGFTLAMLITAAWDVTPEMLSGATKWLDSNRFDIVAKAPSAGEPSSQSLDIEDLRPMLRALLIERFKLATHTAVQPMPVYALKKGKREPKLTRPDPSARTECRYTPVPPGADAGSPLMSGRVCHNTTLAEFAEQMQPWAPGYLDHPVVDMTGIAGAWDFGIFWSAKRFTIGSGLGAGPGGLTPAGGDSIGLTIFEAVDRQMGLKLEPDKHPMPVLVIDHVEEKPTEN
jgi:uncharacterized protein (TIGR03435 family)